MRFLVAVLALPLVVRASFPRGITGHTLARSALPLFGRQTTSACTSECSDPSDEAAASGIANCPTTDTGCICTLLNELTEGCLSCVIEEEDLTESEIEQACGSVGSGAATSTIGASTPSTTATACSAQCSSASDQAAEAQLDACADNDTNCQCSAIAAFSSTCLSCQLAAAGLSEADIQEECSAPASASIPAGASPTVTTAAPASSSTGAGTLCTSQCSDPTDEAANNYLNSCAATDIACECTAFGQFSTACATCVLNTIGMTPAQLSADCSSLGASEGGGGASSVGSATHPTAASVPATTASGGSGSGSSPSSASGSGSSGSGSSTHSSGTRSVGHLAMASVLVAMVLGAMAVLA